MLFIIQLKQKSMAPKVTFTVLYTQIDKTLFSIISTLIFQPLPSPSHIPLPQLVTLYNMYSQSKLSLLSYTKKKKGSHTVIGSLCCEGHGVTHCSCDKWGGGGGHSEAEGGWGLNIWIVPYMNCALFINFIIHTVQASTSLANIQWNWKHITDWKEMSPHLF